MCDLHNRLDHGKTGWVFGNIADKHTIDFDTIHRQVLEIQVCRYLVKDFGTSQSPKSTRQRDSRYCP
ncbi:MAG: hypothetical protein AB2813_00095, partial [Candidatus Sedimenticola endophacoides]